MRRVPAGWQHPKNEAGHFVPLLGRCFRTELREWKAEKAYWDAGWRRAYGETVAFKDSDGNWAQREGKYASMSFEEWHGAKPQEECYMPEWPAEECTLLMMYEDTSEGTPISPAFQDPDELAFWLADNAASAFGDHTASYESWLAMIKRGWACSVVMDSRGIRSGVEGLPALARGSEEPLVGKQ